MAFTQEDLDRVTAALANGTVVRIRDKYGREMQYRSVDELLRLRNEILAELDPSGDSVGTGGWKTHAARYKKGVR